MIFIMQLASKVGVEVMAVGLVVDGLHKGKRVGRWWEEKYEGS